MMYLVGPWNLFRFLFNVLRLVQDISIRQINTFYRWNKFQYGLMELDRWINSNKALFARKMMFFMVPPTPSMGPFPWLFSLQFHLSSTPSKNYPLRDGTQLGAKLCEASITPSDDFFILSYYTDFFIVFDNFLQTC